MKKRKNIAILGGGESGVGAAQLSISQGYDVFLSDAGVITLDKKKVLDDLSIKYEENQHTLESILKADIIVKSPGIPNHAKVIVEAQRANIPVISEIEFAFRHIGDAKVIAITGTNGKTTTTMLTFHLLKTANFDVALVGNVGISFSSAVAKKAHGFYVVEISSFQLDDIDTFRPDVAILLNITPDHLDRYDNDFEKYICSKARITLNQDELGDFIYFSDDVVLEKIADSSKAQKKNISLSNHLAAAYLAEDILYFSNIESFSLAVADLPLRGKHNMINLMAAVLAVDAVGMLQSDIINSLSTFVNIPHRLEYIDKIDKVEFVNDSKATNVDATYYALESFRGDIIWIAGGVDKGNDYTVLDDSIVQKVKLVVSLGTDNSPLESHVTHLKFKTIALKKATSMEQAVEIAYRHANNGDTILLSPACASFDLFESYEDRGNQFKKSVQMIKKQTQLTV